MTVHYSADSRARVVELTISGKITHADFEAVLPQIEAELDRGPLSLVEVIDSFEGFDLDTLWDGLKFDITHWSEFRRVAIVTDMTWFSPFARMADALTHLEVKEFKRNQLDEARDWARNWASLDP
ncbi:STAS/SEC14 domain-containing protein [Dinoroseobacter sp. S76]|uniref:STAS/SEC14 domain-containing protein n=1 Tax=Dinoroseobacter sp. S76 TaxID=3415124 RepID=UPI003C7CBF34